jgi:hypothetical protein
MFSLNVGQVFDVLPDWRHGYNSVIDSQHAEDFVGVPFDTREGLGDGGRWWYINTWALTRTWYRRYRERFEK